MSVTVLLDGSDAALEAVPVAVELAGVLQEELAAMHVGSRAVPDDVTHLGVTAKALDGPLISGSSEGVARELGQRVTGTAVFTCALGLDIGVPNLPTRLLTTLPHPIVWVPPRGGARPWQIGEVLLPYDGSPATAASLGGVVTLVRASKARLRVLHVAAPGKPHEPSFTVPRYVDQPQYEWPAWSHEFLARLASLCPIEELQVKLELGHGAPDEAVVAAARGVDLVVVAWHGHLEADRARVIKALVSHATTPVWIERVHPASQGARTA